MEWSDLAIFLAAVRAGTYTAAARALEINRTTVGRRVEALEEALGVALFEHSPLGFAPTPEGLRLLAAAERIEGEVRAMVADLGATPPRAAPLRIAASGGLGSEFLPELAAFQRANPDVPVQLLGELDPLEAVTQRRAEVGLALVRALPQRLSGVQVGVMAQATYGRRGMAGLPALGWGYEFAAALPGAPWSTANPAGEEAQAAGLSTCNAWPQMIGAVRAGMGTARLWCFAADADPLLERLDEPSPRHDSPLWLVHRSKAPPSPAQLRLIAFLEQALPARIQALPRAAAAG